ncbi:MAG: protein kinase [Myxococcota bacterium]
MDDALNLLDGLDIDIPDAALRPGQDGKPGASQAQFFGPYQLIQEVGVGGVARVQRARHIHPQYAETTFALKILHDDLSRDPRVVGLFRNEAYVLSMLNHPNIVRTFEAGAQDDKLFIAMEYIDGRDLDEMVSRCKKARIKIPLPIALHIIGEVLKGLDYAHGLCDADGNRINLVHRDVNPANVFLSYDGRVKLGDFGVAAIAAGYVEKSREVAGKVGYFAPEQIEGTDVDQRVDLFAVGVMMFEVLTGSRLFKGSDTSKIMRLNKRAKIPKPSKINPAIGPGLEKVILRALERRPADRYRTARDMVNALGPSLPDASGMPLAVAALMRKAFLREHMQELELREGLSGGVARGSGQLIALFSRDERAQEAFNELLLSRGYRVETHETFETLAGSVASGSPPSLVLMDLCSEGFSSDAAVMALARASRRVPVVAVSEGLEPDRLRDANALGAVDLLFKPFNIERVLSAVRATITGAARIANDMTGEQQAVPEVRQRLLLVSRDPKLIERLSEGLATRGFDLEVSPTTAEAIERTHHASYHAIVYDAHPASPADRLFARQFRGRAGIGLVPIVFLAEPGAHNMFTGVDADRSAIRKRDDSILGIVETLNRLLADTRLGRTFVRYSTQFPAELRFTGRVFQGEATDISRGGVMMRCDQIPPIGAEVSVHLKPPNATTTIQVKGRVVRVEPPSVQESERHLPGIGIEFDHFAGTGETDLIKFIGTLDPSFASRSRVIMSAPPALDE